MLQNFIVETCIEFVSKYNIFYYFLEIVRIFVKRWNIFGLIHPTLTDSLACLPHYEYEYIIYHIMALEILEPLSTAK